MLLEHLGVIGNCQFSALIERTGEVVWCLPAAIRFRARIFNASRCRRQAENLSSVRPMESLGDNRYIDNTNILKTTFETASGKFQVIDFAPRFVQYERIIPADSILPDRRADRRDASDSRVLRTTTRLVQRRFPTS